MFGIDSEKLIILAVIVAVVLGPKRLPEYAKKLADWVRRFRSFADNAQAQLSQEMGEDVDWRKLDPRQYDPRRIIREALSEPVGHTAAVQQLERETAREAARQPIQTLNDGEAAPFDNEAT